MSRKVTWKKGMRLTAEIFTAADDAREEASCSQAMLASSGRIGLFSSDRPFELSVSVSDNILEIVSLNCQGVTRSGKIIDIDFDSEYSKTSDTRITIPDDGPDLLILAVRIHDKEWREIDGTYSEEKYTFELLGPNSKIDNHSLPVGCLVNQYGWRLDESGFVPPCLYVNSHPGYTRQFGEITSLVRNISEKCCATENCAARLFLSVVWPAAADTAIRFEQERNTLSPQQMYAGIQSFVYAFYIGCSLDKHISLVNQEDYIRYARKPYNVISVYRDIEEGLALCAEIEHKIDVVCEISETEEQHAAKEPEQPKPDRNRWKGFEI